MLYRKTSPCYSTKHPDVSHNNIRMFHNNTGCFRNKSLKFQSKQWHNGRIKRILNPKPRLYVFVHCDTATFEGLAESAQQSFPSPSNHQYPTYVFFWKAKGSSALRRPLPKIRQYQCLGHFRIPIQEIPQFIPIAQMIRYFPAFVTKT